MAYSKAAMKDPAQRKRLAATALLSAIVTFLLFLGGFLVGSYLSGRFGPPSNDPDDILSYSWGIRTGGVFAVIGTTAFLRVIRHPQLAKTKQP